MTNFVIHGILLRLKLYKVDRIVVPKLLLDYIDEFSEFFEGKSLMPTLAEQNKGMWGEEVWGKSEDEEWGKTGRQARRTGLLVNTTEQKKDSNGNTIRTFGAVIADEEKFQLRSDYLKFYMRLRDHGWDTKDEVKINDK